MKKLLIIAGSLLLLFLGAGAVNYLVQPDQALESTRQDLAEEELVSEESVEEMSENSAEANDLSKEETDETTVDGSSDETEESTEDESSDIAEEDAKPVTEETSTEISKTESALIKTDFPNTQIRDAFGNVVNLHDKLDKPTIINVWASWCPPCREEMPYFQNQYDQHKDDINFIMLNAIGSRPTETVEKANEFLQEFDYTFPVYYDINRSNQIRLQVLSLPSTYIIDANGQSQRIIGMLTEDQLAEIVDELLED